MYLHLKCHKYPQSSLRTNERNLKSTSRRRGCTTFLNCSEMTAETALEQNIQTVLQNALILISVSLCIVLNILRNMIYSFRLKCVYWQEEYNISKIASTAFEQLGSSGNITILLSGIQHPPIDQNNADQDNYHYFDFTSRDLD